MKRLQLTNSNVVEVVLGVKRREVNERMTTSAVSAPLAVLIVAVRVKPDVSITWDLHLTRACAGAYASDTRLKPPSA